MEVHDVDLYYFIKASPYTGVLSSRYINYDKGFDFVSREIKKDYTLSRIVDCFVIKNQS